MPVYKLNGDAPEESWNELIRRVNELVQECSDIEELDEVEGPTLWYKSHPDKTMIQQVQDKLIEVCEDNEFDDIPDLWKQTVIDDMLEAIEAGQCCCEQKDVELNDPPQIFQSSDKFESGFVIHMFDWAKRVMDERNGPLIVETFECPVEGEEEPIELERRTGGKGYVGEEFTTWEFYALNDETGFDVDENEPIATGDVVDGYIDIGEGEYLPLATCEEPDLPVGTPLGTDDPNWGFPYETTPPFASGGVIVQQPSVISNDGQQTFFNVETTTVGFVIGRPTSPYFLRVGSFHPNPLSSYDLKFILRLKCDSNEEEV